MTDTLQRSRLVLVLAALCASAIVVCGSAAGSAPARGEAANGLAAPAGVAQRASGEPSACGRDGVVCRRVSVPLDWSGRRPGKVSLQVEVRRTEGQARGVMFLLAGGPGQSSIQSFLIGEGSFWSELLPGYTLVVVDPRGTGYSGPPLRCRVAASTRLSGAAQAAACARQLGARRDYFRTADNAMDLEAVRKALGFRKVGLFGVSYGTIAALAYARAFPGRVSRLLLDSVASPLTDLRVVADVFGRIPAALRAYCARACTGATATYARDVVALANSLARAPLHGGVRELDGSARPMRLDATRFLSLVVQTDLDPGLAAEMPAAVLAARRGEPEPLLRLAELAEGADQAGIADAVYLATSCGDGPFPWEPETPIAERPALLERAARGLSTRSLGGFGRWVTGIGNASLCLEWPSPSAPPPSAANGSYPDVPVLALSGDYDLRSPRTIARAVLTEFPHGQLVEVTNAGHSTLARYSSVCVVAAVASWVEGGRVPRTCRTPQLLAPLAAFPSDRARGRASLAETLSLVRRTIDEAHAVWLGASEGTRFAGLRSGALVITNRGFALTDYSIGRGVAVTGDLRAKWGPAARFYGVVSVEQQGATIGTLAVNGSGLDGSLAGRPVIAGRLARAAESGGAARPSRGWSAWAPAAGSVASVTRAIARHVGRRYRIEENGPRLLDIHAAPPRSPRGERPLVAIAVETPSSAGDPHYSVTSGTWAYTLCGGGAYCSIASGPSTAVRGRLVRREALELALYTFAFVPSLTSLIVYAPPARGAGPSSAVLRFERGRLAKELSRPLARTLAPATALFPQELGRSEAATVDRLTLPRLFTFTTRWLENGGAELLLTPS